MGGLHANSYGLTFDPGGNLYVAQEGSGIVAKVLPNGTESPFVAGLDHPQAGTSDPFGNIYVATAISLSGETVIKITPGGVTSTFATGVTGILWDSAGNLFTGNFGSVTRTTPSGQTSALAEGITTPVPKGLGRVGDLYVFDGAGANNLLEISPGGDVTTVAHLPNALGVAVSAPEPSMPLVIAAFLIIRARPRRQTKL